MPGIPLVARETIQMCRQESRVHLSVEEEIAAEASLSVYCKPVELYNILQRRAIRNPTFLQRCLHYKMEKKHKRRIQMTISLTGTAPKMFPMYVLLGRRVSSTASSECSVVYRFSQARALSNFSGVEKAHFVLPEINKLEAEAKTGSLAIVLVSCVENKNNGSNHLSMTSFLGYCLWGMMPVESLYMSWGKSPSMSLGQRAEIMSTVDMKPCFVKILQSSGSDEDKCISFQIPYKSGNVITANQVQLITAAEEVGAKEKSPYNSYTYSGINSSSLSDIMRLRTGNVIFNYRYYNNRLQRTEVTEDFSCAFCLVKCASFKGLRYHLCSSHDMFNFEFWVTEEYQAVNVSVNTDSWRSEVVPDEVDPKQQTFFFCSKRRRRGRTQKIVHSANHVLPLVLDSDLPAEADGGTELRNGIRDYAECVDRVTPSPNDNGVSNAIKDLSCADTGCAHSVPESSLAPPAILQFAKTRKLSFERPDPRNRVLLQKRQFFHSHRAQPMAMEQVLSDRDSEDEVDDDVADFEDRRMLDDFVDVTKDEKQMMHLWNSFVRKQRVLADGHIPWACEAFSKLHGQELVGSPALVRCWRLFMVKLWNHGLLDARTMNNCNIIIEQIQKPGL